MGPSPLLATRKVRFTMSLKLNRAGLLSLVAALVLVLMTGSPAVAAPAKAASAAAGPVDINAGTQAQLESLPGIGPATAKKIIAGRPYSTVADLSRAGVNAKTLQQFTPLVTVSAPMATGNTAAVEPI